MQKSFVSLVIIAGLTPMISLSLLSFTDSGIWLSWTQLVSQTQQRVPIWGIDATLATFAGSWVTLTAIGALLLLWAATRRTSAAAFAVVGISILAQLPGVISHTKFQWLWLGAAGRPFAGEHDIVLVGLVLAATPIGIYSRVAASAFESVTQALIQGNADSKGVQYAQRSNFLLLSTVMAAALAIGLLTLGLWAGLPDGITALFANFGPALVWTSVAGSIVAMAFFYSYLYGKWSSPLRPGAAQDLALQAVDGDGPQPGR